jgi:hypothetical protein
MKKINKTSLNIFIFWVFVCLFPVILFGENWINFFAFYNLPIFWILEKTLGTFYLLRHPILTMIFCTFLSSTVFALIVKVFGELIIIRKKEKGKMV